MADVGFALIVAGFCLVALAFQAWGFAFVFFAAIVVILWHRMHR